jgi:hypothetical protein
MAPTGGFPFRASITLETKSGPPGNAVVVSGSGFGALETVRLRFIDSVSGRKRLVQVGPMRQRRSRRR